MEAPAPTHLDEVLWAEPYPDALLDTVPSAAPGPDAVFDAGEAVSLAFVTALQHLPPRQRAVVVLRDVLGYPAAEAAEMLAVTEESVTNAESRPGRPSIACVRRRAHVASHRRPPAQPPSGPS